MNKYGRHGKFKALYGKGDELATILLEASKSVSQVKGCILYIVSKDWKDEDSIWVTELWNTKEDHDDSLKIPIVKTLISKALPLIDENPEKSLELIVIGGYGIN